VAGGRETPYQQARDAGRTALRQAVLEAAGRLLSAEGPASLTMRRIAEQIGASTTVLYGIFDDKNAIIDAMVTEGHKALRARLDAIPDTLTPVEHLAATGRGYREAALADPARYQLMFGSTIPGYERSATARAAAQESFDPLLAAVRGCIDAGIISRSADARFVAEILVAAAHGAVSLELTGHFDDPARADERFAVLTAAALRPFLADQG
jgi:AcrR family transcriptional regulator